MSGFGEAYRAFDRYQQRHAWLGFPLAVRQKYADDQGGYLAVTIAYYAFFSIFPLLLLLVTVLGFLLRGDPGLQRQVLHSALGQFPVIGDQLQSNVHSLTGSGVALAIGIAGALWAGTGVAVAAQNAMNHLWGIPFKSRPDPIRQRVRALLVLLVLGGGSLVATVLAGIGTSSGSYGAWIRIGSILFSLGANILLFWAAFQILTAKELPWRDLRTGAIAAAVLWEVLQTVGGYYVTHELKSASTVYGTFGFVIGLLSWLYLGSHITLLAAEANVVSSRRLWPRSFSVIVEEPRTSADEAALRQRSGVEERRQDQEVEVVFEGERRAET